MRSLAALDPRLDQTYRSFRHEWPQGMATIGAGMLGRTCGSLLADLSVTVRRDLFIVVEQGLVEGTDEVQTVMATGFLEAMYNAVSGDPGLAKLMWSSLGPESADYVRGWERLVP